MKLQKLLYLIQRESFIQNDEPMFYDSFCGWRFGPVIYSIRDVYKKDAFLSVDNCFLSKKDKDVVLSALKRYMHKDSWSLSRLTHGESSWKKSRIGVDPNYNSNTFLSLDDIRLDAKRIKRRREFLAKMGLIYENY